jgi:Na+/proline symporter
MKLTILDISIVVLYLATMVAIGWVLRKRARKNKESYLLGGKALPWYMLGLSDASDMFDISGTMWMVALCFVYGMKSMWIPWLWPVFNQVFMMMFISKWVRRSNASTGAEWLVTRFGASGKGVKSSHNVVVAFALLSCFGFLAYGFVGLGKFIEIFVPWNLVSAYVPFTVAPEYVPHLYGIVFTLFAMFYSILGGMHSIVLGDVIKYVIMTVACISIAVIAMLRLHSPGTQLAVPANWTNPFFNWRLDLNWSNLIPDANKKIAEDGFGLFGFFFMMMLFKGIFASLAGPAPNYDMQKVLSTRSPKDASKMSGFVSIILLPVRYSMIIGLTVLALLYYNQLDLRTASGTDFERILPAAINDFLPAGILGLVLTGLLGAFMGTFSGTLNAAQAYIVNDIYLKYVDPHASTKKIMTANYLVGIVVVAIGVTLGFFAMDRECFIWGLYRSQYAEMVLVAV